MSISVTENAAKRIQTVVGKDGREGAFLRILVQGGGCQGFQYELLVDSKPMDGDVSTAQTGARVVVDGVSMQFLEGAQVDWVSDLTGESFRITNPNAASTCGCGTSFSA